MALTSFRNATFEPGGWLETLELSSVPLLDLSIRPRMSLYFAGEEFGSFIVDAAISFMNGKPYVNASLNMKVNITNPFDKLFIDISLASGMDLVSSRNVTVNTTSNEIGFSLSGLTPRFEPYQVVMTGASGDATQFFTATTDFYYLPERSDGGSVTKIDNLYGGLVVQDYLTNSTEWLPIFPYTFYVSWDGWLERDINSKS